jgi:hypothetical protein
MPSSVAVACFLPGRAKDLSTLHHIESAGHTIAILARQECLKSEYVCYSLIWTLVWLSYAQQKLGEGFIYLIATLCIAALFVRFESAAMSYPHSLECSMSTILQLAHQGQTRP